jgi:hypothetical protein
MNLSTIWPCLGLLSFTGILLAFLGKATSSSLPQSSDDFLTSYFLFFISSGVYGVGLLLRDCTETIKGSLFVVSF